MDYSKLNQTNEGHIEAIDAFFNQNNDQIKIFVLQNSVNYETRESVSKVVQYDFDVKKQKKSPVENVSFEIK